MAKVPLPPWRRAEREDEDRDRRVEKTKIENISENETPTPEHYVYNRGNFTPGVVKPDTSANSAVMKSLSNTVYDTCQDSPC